MTIAFSQSGSTTWTGGATNGSLSVTTAAAGELVLIGINTQGGASYASNSVSGAGLTWTRRASIQYNGRLEQLELWYAFAPEVLSAAEITINTAPQQGYCVAVFATFSGVPSSIFDPNSSLPASDGSGNASAVISTSTAPCVGIALSGSAYIGGSTGSPSGWTPGPSAHLATVYGYSYINFHYMATEYSTPQTNLTVAATSPVGAPIWIVDALSEVDIPPPPPPLGQQGCQISIMT